MCVCVCVCVCVCCRNLTESFTYFIGHQKKCTVFILIPEKVTFSFCPMFLCVAFLIRLVCYHVRMRNILEFGSGLYKRWRRILLARSCRTVNVQRCRATKTIDPYCRRCDKQSSESENRRFGYHRHGGTDERWSWAQNSHQRRI